MSTRLIKKIGYWFFLFAGMIGLCLQIYHMLFTLQLEPTYAQGIISVFLGVFIGRPNWVSDVWKYILNILKLRFSRFINNNNNEAK